jgi:hypothetical protein
VVRILFKLCAAWLILLAASPVTAPFCSFALTELLNATSCRLCVSAAALGASSITAHPEQAAVTASNSAVALIRQLRATQIVAAAITPFRVQPEMTLRGGIDAWTPPLDTQIHRRPLVLRV